MGILSWIIIGGIAGRIAGGIMGMETKGGISGDMGYWADGSCR